MLATNVFAGRPAGDEVVAFGLDVTVGQPSLATFLSATVGPVFEDTSVLTPGTDVSGLAPLPIDASTNCRAVAAHHAHLSGAKRGNADPCL